MNSSRCRSDGEPPERHPGPPSRRRRPDRNRQLLEWIPVLLLVFLGVAVISFWRREPQGLRQDRSPRRPAWLPAGSGKVEFLGVTQRFQVFRSLVGERFRVAREDATAFESRRLAAVARLFVRSSLAGLHPGDSMTICWRVREAAPPAGGAARRPSLCWSIQFEKEMREGEPWYRSLHGTTGQPIYARSMDDLKDTTARELGRDVAAYFAGELVP